MWKSRLQQDEKFKYIFQDSYRFPKSINAFEIEHDTHSLISHDPSVLQQKITAANPHKMYIINII